eukprot:maker-scaffold285_size222332-snap-gene-1.21 protein:Tk07157 transcript:maker-scaffold285_size222332-snap-gene-1.21-mRNA-1 annotation:"sodium channel protein type 4 subunit alpha"
MKIALGLVVLCLALAIASPTDNLDSSIELEGEVLVSEETDFDAMARGAYTITVCSESKHCPAGYECLRASLDKNVSYHHHVGAVLSSSGHCYCFRFWFLAAFLIAARLCFSAIRAR